MAKAFFSKFPKIGYDIDGDGTFLSLTNIVNNVNVNSLYADESTYYTFYEISDGERPDIVSYKLYGDPGYHWTFFIINNEMRNGLSDAWPLSNQQFERMLANEYDQYAAITFLPSSILLTGIGENGLFNLTDLSGKYLPYLRLHNVAGTQKASILKYDNDTLQLVIYDIRQTADNAIISDTTTFVEDSTAFRLVWENPYDPNDVEEADEYAICEELRKEYVLKHIAIYSQFDPFAIIDPDRISAPTPELVAQEVLNQQTIYIFQKQYIPATASLRWTNYRNAASIYYFENGDAEKFSRTAYDMIADPNVITYTFISNYEREELVNEQKRKIRVIRPDRITDFVNEYFEVLNG